MIILRLNLTKDLGLNTIWLSFRGLGVGSETMAVRTCHGSLSVIKISASEAALAGGCVLFAELTAQRCWSWDVYTCLIT